MSLMLPGQLSSSSVGGPDVLPRGWWPPVVIRSYSPGLFCEEEFPFHYRLLVLSFMSQGTCGFFFCF